jgi:hypothetical protein
MIKSLSVASVLISILANANSVSSAAEAYIVAEPRAIVTKATSTYALEFEMSYVLQTTDASEDICSAFPREAFGGTRASCNAYSASGLVVNFSSPIFWLGVLVIYQDSPIGEAVPVEIVAATADQRAIPFVAGDLRYQDSLLGVHEFDFGTLYRSDTLLLVPDSQSDVATLWSASVCVEPQVTYEDSEGAVVGTLLLSQIGGSPFCVSTEFPGLFHAVPLETSSWGLIKSLY